MSGEVVKIDPYNDGKVKRSDGMYDSSVIGVISTNPGLLLAGKDRSGMVAVALAGRVPVKITGEGGDIRPGDPIASSALAGYATKATTTGSIIGRALESVYFGDTPSIDTTGTVMMVVQNAFHMAGGINEGVDIISMSTSTAAENSAEALQPASGLPEISLPLGSQIAQGLGAQIIVVQELAVRGRIIVEGDTHLRGQLYLGTSLSGSVAINPNEDRVTVRFTNPMETAPRIQATAHLEMLNDNEAFDNDVWDGTYYIANITADSFEIRLPGRVLCLRDGPCPAKL